MRNTMPPEVTGKLRRALDGLRLRVHALNAEHGRRGSATHQAGESVAVGPAGAVGGA